MSDYFRFYCTLYFTHSKQDHTMATVTKHLILSGRVQGVGFRHFTKTKAEQAGLTGWVYNKPNGDVEAVLQGDEEAVEIVVQALEEGPRMARVDSIREHHSSDKIGQAYPSFDVRR
ncbi:MAG: acylphosphatase [Balneolaceae bacterium]